MVWRQDLSSGAALPVCDHADLRDPGAESAMGVCVADGAWHIDDAALVAAGTAVLRRDGGRGVGSPDRLRRARILPGTHLGAHHATDVLDGGVCHSGRAGL